MSFAETYQEEVLQSRRDRSRRAFFWARIVGLVLMITIGAVLRAEPDLRRALMNAGIDTITNLANLSPKNAGQVHLSEPAQTAQRRLPDRVKVNRFGGTDTTVPEAEGLAQALGNDLSNRQIGN